MRKLLYAAILLAVFFAPVRRVDIAKLQPVEAVALYVQDNVVVLETDTESIGVGKTVDEAFRNLKECTPAVIYLDTARYLLVSENAKELQNQIYPYLKENVITGVYNGTGVKEEAKYLDAHYKPAAS
jgi:hypothetical protein